MTIRFKRLGALFALLSVMLFVGCSEPEPEMAYQLQLSTHGLGFDAEGGTLKIAVTPHPDTAEWRVDNANPAEWVEIEVTEGAINVTAEPNSESSSRTTSFSVVSPTNLFEAVKITLSQEAATAATLEVVAPEEYLFDSAASSYTFGVRSNVEWTIEDNAEWLTVAAEYKAQRATIAVEANDGEVEREAEVRITAGDRVYIIDVKQDTHANNQYYRLLGNWEITASKWFYSPNGSLNSLDYAPNPTDYYLVFKLDEVEYGKTLIMRDFLYPGTELEVRYDATTGGIVIPFGWTVLSYDVFCYVTLVSSTQFSYASMEVEALPNDECTALTLNLPTVDGFNYVGFGLWTYDESGNKVAVGSNYRPTMFPMGNVQLVKKSE